MIKNRLVIFLKQYFYIDYFSFPHIYKLFTVAMIYKIVHSSHKRDLAECYNETAFLQIWYVKDLT